MNNKSKSRKTLGTTKVVIILWVCIVVVIFLLVGLILKFNKNSFYDSTETTETVGAQEIYDTEVQYVDVEEISPEESVYMSLRTTTDVNGWFEQYNDDSVTVDAEYELRTDTFVSDFASLELVADGDYIFASTVNYAMDLADELGISKDTLALATYSSGNDELTEFIEVYIGDDTYAFYSKGNGDSVTISYVKE
jgi:hypothetical protein